MTQRQRVFSAILTLCLLAVAGGVSATQPDQYEEIASRMAEIRGLPLVQPLNLTVVDRDELRELMRQDIDENYPPSDQERDLRVLVLFGLVEPGTDLGELQSDILGEQVAGYYDPETDEMVVVSEQGGEEFSAGDELTFAHEVVHALQDQHFDLLAVQGDPEALTDDESLAISALIEGDASVGQLEYLLANPLLLRALRDEISEIDTSVLDNAPPIFARTLLFPYDEGADFVAELYDNGGWEAVNDAFRNPPESTEQILHPEKYSAGEAPHRVDVYDPTSQLGDGWEIIDVNAMGELIMRIFLEGNGVSEDEAAVAAEGWGGDRYVVVGTDEETALVWRSSWDSEQDADEYFAALVQHELRRFDTRPEDRDEHRIRFRSGDWVGEIRRDGTEVVYVLAPDAASLAALWESQEAAGRPLTLPIDRRR